MNRPKVGVGAFVTHPAHPGCILLGKRKGKSAGSNTYALPGGHLEFGEEWTECSDREVLEETGLTVKNTRVIAVRNVVSRSDAYHYVVIFTVAECQDESAEPQTREPDKCYGWEWVTWNYESSFPSPLFRSLEVLRKEQFSPFSTGDDKPLNSHHKLETLQEHTTSRGIKIAQAATECKDELSSDVKKT